MISLVKNRYTLVAAAGVFALAISLAGCKKTAAPVDDATLNNSVQTKISSDAALGGQPIQISTANGVVTLSGTVDSEAVRTLAANDAMQVPGIKMLNNNLTVQVAPTPMAQMPMEAPLPAPVAPAMHSRKPSAAAPPPLQQTPYRQAPAPITQNAPPPLPPPPAKPVVRTITLAAGSVLPIRTTETLETGTTQPGAVFHGVLAADVTDSNGNVAFAAGAPVAGQVVDAKDAAHFKGSSLLTIQVTSISFHGERIAVSTEPYSVEGKGRGKNTAAKVGGGAAVGAILGGIFGGGKGAAIGAAAGGGVGAGANAVTKGQQVSIPSESIVRFRLTNAVSVTR
ncbi:MAG TPA: BON domain-containing protein [Acidobacteriaceae bacterium]